MAASASTTSTPTSCCLRCRTTSSPTAIPGARCDGCSSRAFAGRIRELQNYDFVDPDAKRQFEELLASLREQAMKPFMSGMERALGDMSAEDLARMREMIQDLNRMLRERMEGREPDFEAFKQKWGQHFPGVESLDQLLEQLARQS